MSVTITRNPNLSKIHNSQELQNEVQQKFKNQWWTGLKPEDCVGFDHQNKSLHALPLLNLDIATKQDVLDYFNNTWTLSELLFQSLKTEETYTRSPYHGLRHPMMFYYGHTAVLFINKLRLSGLLKDPINLYLEKVLETGVDEMSWDDMSKNEKAWPSLEEVHGYKKIAYQQIINLIETRLTNEDIRKKDYLNSPWWALWMGMEHEKIHFETSSVLIRELPVDLVETPKYWPQMHPTYLNSIKKDNSWVAGKAKEVRLGKELTTPSFGWDNEYGHRSLKLSAFEYTNYQITNHEYYEFVASGSYIDDKYWSQEGLQWRKFRNTKRPTFWTATGPEGSHEYELRTLFKVIPMPWGWPCEVNFHEAKAFINYKQEKDSTKYSYRLLTEAEFISVARETKTKDAVLQVRNFNDYSVEDIKNQYQANFNFKYSSPADVTEGFYGNVWHWLEDQFNPLDDFKVHPLYDDFSTPCFDGKHQMILGGSFISCGHEASHWARFHFRPHFYQHAGFRMARTLDGSADNQSTKINKSTEYVHQKRVNLLDQLKAEKWWERVLQPLEITDAEIKYFFEITEKYLSEYKTENLNQKPMGLAHDPATNKLKENFIVPLQQTKNFPSQGENYEDLMKIIFKDLAPLGQHPGHPGFAAYVAGSGNMISNLGQLISMSLNQFTGHNMMSPGLVAVENEVIQWLLSLVGYDKTKANGFLTTGSSYATQAALMIARKAKLDGYDYSKVTGYMSADSHHCVAKAWVMLGFKKENLRLIKTKNFKIDVLECEQQILQDKKIGLTPFFLLGTAGSTKTGYVDDLDGLNKLAKKNGLWFHIDAAYGGFFLLTENKKRLFLGIESADSIALDPHKSLSIPYGTGCLLVRDKSQMIFDYLSDDSYMPPKPEEIQDYADISPELSRDSRGLRIWLPIKTLGISPFILNLEEKLKLSQWLTEQLHLIQDLIVVSEPELSIITFRHRSGDDKTKKLLKEINQSGVLFLSSCLIDNKFTIRVCLLGYRLHFERLEKALSEIKNFLQKI